MAHVLILGEHDKGHGEPFSLKTVSGRRLRRMVAEIRLDADLGNVFEYRDGHCLERDLRAVCDPYREIVALGKIASAECKRQCIEHRQLPHPAVRSGTQLARLRTGLEGLAGCKDG